MATKTTSSISSSEVTTITGKLFTTLTAFGTGKSDLTESTLGQCFGTQCIFESKGTVRAKGLTEITKRWRGALKTFSSFSISGLISEPLVDENQAVIRYNVDATTASGSRTQLQVMACLTFENSKIVSWTQVIHEKDTGTWDS